MKSEEILKELEKYGSEQTKKVLSKHGAKEPFFGVKVADLKKILKKTKKNHELSLELYSTGNSDAMYLAGLMADEKKISEAELDKWANEAYWYYLSDFAVPWVASETDFGFELGLKWIESDLENVTSCGWATLANYASIHPDDMLDNHVYSQLLDRVALKIHEAPNAVRSTMNGFVIAVGSYMKELSEKAMLVSEKIGKVEVLREGTSCKVPLATVYIRKMVDKGHIGKKRKQARC